MKHHYVPQYYLKGFLNPNQDLCTYIKDGKSTKHFKPGQIMYEKNLYTSKISNEEHQFIEELYSGLESSFAKVQTLIDRAIKANNNSILCDDYTSSVLKLQIAFQFWRLPHQRASAKAYLKHIDFKCKIRRTLLHKNTGLEKYFLKKILKNTHKGKKWAFQMYQNILLPFYTFEIFDTSDNLKLYKIPEDEKLITSDNPIVSKNSGDLFSFKNLYYPLSQTIFVYGKDFAPKTYRDLNYKIAKQSKKYIVSPSRDLLDDIIQGM